MVVIVAGGGKKEEHSPGHVEFKMPIRCPVRERIST